jgi:serine/threonine protein kinase
VGLVPRCEFGVWSSSGDDVKAGDLIQSRYRLNRVLGSGASGSVWAAKNELIDRDVALKMMAPSVAEDAVALQRFFNEAKASGRVRSPCIVEILDLGQAEDGSPFLVFELLEGEGIDERLRRDHTIAPEALLELLIGVARALGIAHAQSIVHRDLKPANIFIHTPASGETVAKILDFGISKIFDSGQPNFSLTRTGMVVGSPAYMSPEQAAGQEDIDGRADVWSLGVVMYEALTGSLPHEAPNYNALMVRILTQDVDPIHARKPDLPPSVAAIVDQCLKRERTQRPKAAQLADMMDAALQELRAARFRTQGRRSTDRAEPEPRRDAVTQVRSAVALPGATQKRQFLLYAVAIGIVLGLVVWKAIDSKGAAPPAPPAPSPSAR